MIKSAKKSLSCFCFFPFDIFAVAQIQSTWNQNQRTGINIFSGNFKEENKGKTRGYKKFQVSVRRYSGDINQTKRSENKVLNEVAAESQKEEHQQLKWSRSQPNFTCRRERNKACDEREIKQHRDAIFFYGDHFFDDDILQRKKESSANRNTVKNIEMKFIVGRPSCDNHQSDESNQCCNPTEFCYIFGKKNFGKYQRKQWNSPENDNDLGQRKYNHRIDVEKETCRAKNSSNDIHKKLIRFESGLSLRDYERNQCNQTEKESEESHLKCTESLPHEFRNNIVGATDKHLTEKESDSLPISIQDHKFSEIKSRLFITFMVNNENIF